MFWICPLSRRNGSQANAALGQSSYASAIDNCLWDILGKAVNLPLYRLLGAYKDRVRAYASSQHLNTVDEFIADLDHARVRASRHTRFIRLG